MAEAQHQQRHHEASIPSLLNSHDQITSSRPSAPFPPILHNTSSPPLTAKLPPIHSSRPSVEWMNDHGSKQDKNEGTPSTSPIPETNDSINSTPNNDNNTTSTTSDKQYACGECDQTFGRPHNLKSHLATHSNERSYECEVCHHQFRRHHDLKRHQKLHTGEKPFVCAICMRSFARLDALNRHQRAEGGTSCSGVAPAQRRRLTNSGNSRSNSLNEDVKVSPKTDEKPNGERRSSSFSVLEGNHNASHSDPYRAYTYPVPHIRNDRTMSYPPPMSMSGASQQHVFTVNQDANQSDRIRQLEKRNRDLEVEVSTYRASIRSLKDMDTLKRKVHDLEIENKVLRSLLVDNNAEGANNPSKRKRRESTSSQTSTPVEPPQPPLHSPRKENSVAVIDEPHSAPASIAHLTSSFGNLPHTRSPEPM
ncbi:hypothetical protein INT43_008258 [Umbelopsis isabellina]|uniref:C2H2-type domain-containing protein n=1 Tax=Mortierella isabellina TaxID=91625 RepID=A0A8H7U857_MORIS|nr:hypothetical protein INT43_008258 [Umbelopsis isabellina]